MHRKFLFIGVLFVIFQATHGQSNTASRIAGSPYPVSGIPSTLYVIDDWGWGESKRFTVMTLKGLKAKTGDTLIYNKSGVGYSIWLEDLVTNYGVAEDRTYYSDFEGLITHFQFDFDGYILCNLKDNSSNVAVSLCGPMNAIAITSENEALMLALNKPMLLDVRDKDESWALSSSYSDSFSKEIVSFQNEDKCMFLSDYSVFTNAFQFFDSNVNSQLVTDALGRMEDNRVTMGWGPDELNSVKQFSQNSLQLHAADWTENLDVLSNFEADLEQQNRSTSIDDRDNVHTVCFLVSDGDNYDWLLKEFYGYSKAYGSKERGQTSIGWTISPAMCELAPTLMKLFYDKATNTSAGKDFFIGSSSGIGYMYPNLFPDLQESTDLTNEFMGKADLNILNVIGTQYRESDMEKYLGQDNIDAIFYYSFNNYAGLNGAIYEVNEKPVIGARYRLWDGFDDATSLASKLNKQSTNAYTSAGYSLIAVHAWSFNQYVVKEINSCASQLNSNVIVVSPDEFVKRIKAKVGKATSLKEDLLVNDFKVFPNPAHNKNITIQGKFEKDDIIEIIDINSRVIYRDKIKVAQENELKISLKNNISNGLYIIKIARNNKISTIKMLLQNDE